MLSWAISLPIYLVLMMRGKLTHQHLHLFQQWGTLDNVLGISVLTVCHYGILRIRCKDLSVCV